MKSFRLAIGLAVAVGCTAFLPAGPVAAQQGQPSGAGVQALPPALQAAVLSGNGQAVSQALRTLSGNNPTQLAALAAQVVAAAEKLLASNPQAAVNAAAAAVDGVRQSQVQQSAPQQTGTVLTTAARIFVNPAVQRVAPDSVAQLASATVQAASTTSNPTLVASVSASAVATAEKLLTVNPQAAIQIAAVAVESVKNQPVQASAPQQSMEVVTTAARILVNPDVQRIAPQTVAAVASTVVAVATNPVVYQAAPSAAIQVMTNAYAAATSQVVAAVVPSVTTQVTAAIQQAGQNQQLSSTNPTNPAEVAAILAKSGPDLKKEENHNSPTPVVDQSKAASPT